MKDTIVTLRNMKDLKKVLFLQKSITTQAKNELMAVAKGVDSGAISAQSAHKFLKENKLLIDKYAKYPTLSEFHRMPNSYDGYKWGATFGLTLLIGELLFERIKEAHPQFELVIKTLFILLLSELEAPKHSYLIEPLEKHLRFKITTDVGGEVSVEKQKAFVHDLVSKLADTMVAYCDGYGLVKVKKGGVAITPIGKRVLLHLLDASKWVDDMTEAHAKFQNSKPRLSMS